MNKKSSKQKKRFVNTYLSHILISIVALIECLILLSFTTFSWIESSSSLEIVGTNLGIADNMYYQINGDNSGDEVDLSAFFRQTYDFRYAMISTCNGKDFFMPKKNETHQTPVGVNPYRKGDTTDFNTSYRSVDFKFNNETGSTVYYGFDNNKPFTSTISDSALKAKVENAFRFSIEVDNSSSATIYGNSGCSDSYNGIKDTSGNYKTTSTKSIVPVSENTGTQAFRVDNGKVTTITVRVWLEEKALPSLSASDKEAILSSDININIKLRKFSGQPAALKTAIYLEDPIGMFDTSKTMWLMGAKEGTTTRNYQLTWSSDNNRYEYASGLDLDTVSLNDAYFYQANHNAYCNATPQNTGNSATFTLLNKIYYDNHYALGTWGGTQTIYFDPEYLTYYSTSAYNDQTSGVSAKIPMTNVDIYCTTYPTAQNSQRQTAHLTFDSDDQRWSATVPEYFVNSDLYFYYCPSYPGEYAPTASDTMKFSAPSPSVTDNAYIFKPLGFVTIENKDGVGTWEEVDTIDISSELVESTIDPTDRYKVTATFGTTDYSYYMQPRADHIRSFAFVPSTNSVSFTKIVSGSSDITFSPSSSDGKKTYYIAYDKNNETYTGGWTLAVIVDGTAEHLMNDLMSDDTTGAYLRYTHNGSDWYNFTQLDDYRWFTVLDNNIAELPVRWCAYQETNTIFDYTFKTADGMYMTITEE